MKTFLKRLWSLSKPYFVSADWRWAWGLLLAIVALNLGNVYLSVQFNEWYNEFYNSLQNYDKDAFSAELFRFSYLAASSIVMGVYSSYLNQMLQIRWRRWMTVDYIARWLDRKTYYRMQLAGNPADNPDQRIAEDISSFIEVTLNLSLGLLSSVVTLFSFLFILWNLSGDLTIPLGGGKIFVLPGYMVWVVLVYSILGTWITGKLGRPLVALNFDQQRYEADFRFSLVRFRENAESVAFYRGEEQEKSGFFARFSHVFENYWEIMKRNKKLSWFTSGYGQIAVIFPFLVAAPRYFAKQIPLGGLIQISSAFDHVRGSLSFIIDSYTSIANWRAVIQRLSGFMEGVQAVEAMAGDGAEMSRGENLAVSHLNVDLPNGEPLLKDFSLQSAKPAALLVQGPSGSGKSTLLRVLAGLWPFARGNVTLPKGEVLFIPQKPYLPLGTLRDALVYPGRMMVTDEVLQQELANCNLGHLSGRLAEVAPWSHILSLGEQQRIAFLRAMLVKPDVIFLDEATSALDEAGEIYFYKLLRQRLPQALIFSVGHRNTLQALHDHNIQLPKRAA